MEKNRSSKVVAVVALVVAVFGLTLGFAAFSNTLVISSSAHVTPDESAFNVVFSSAAETVAADPIEGIGSVEGVAGDNATITTDEDGNARRITGLKANFTAPGQTVTYTFYVRNEGSYIAYLRSILYKNISESVQQHKACSISEGAQTTQGLVDAACKDIKISVKVGSEEEKFESTDTFKGHSLAVSGNETVVVTISYENNGNPVDGEMDVTFGDIELNYESVDAA